MDTYQEIAGHIVDVRSGDLLKNKVIKIVNGRIASIEDKEHVPNRFLLPGLIDVHVHTILESSPDFPEFRADETSEETLTRMKRNVQQSLKAGITTVRDCGHPGDEIFVLREEIKNNPLLGSRIFCAGPLITTPNGHGRELGLEARGVDEIEQKCIEALKKGADFIKLINNDPDGFSVDEIKKAKEVAHAYGKKLSCHIYQTEPLKRAVDAGVDTIEHFANTTDAVISEIKEKGIIVVPTYVSALDAISHPEANVIGGEEITQVMDEGGFDAWVPQMKVGIEKLIAGGCVFATGSDGGFLHTNFQTVQREIPGLVDLGATPLQVLQAATIHGAKVLGQENNLGSIDENKIGDVVVYKDNPLEDLTTLTLPIAVYKEGLLVT